jgi:hypothetical protein
MSCLTVLLIIAGIILLCVIAVSAEQSKAKKAYQASLRRLKRDPNNPDLREAALRLGRKYSNLLRTYNVKTAFDETALMNDINAACARATVGQNEVVRVEVTNPIVLGAESVAEQVERLGQLFIAGVITAEEFERGKTLFLGAAPDKAASAVELLQNLNALKQQGVISESEFNIKKWEILSERLIPGKMQAARLQPKLVRPGRPGSANTPERIDPRTGRPIIE